MNRNKMIFRLGLFLIAATLVFVGFNRTGAQTTQPAHEYEDKDEDRDEDEREHEHEAMWKAVSHATCALTPTDGNTATGVVTFTEADGEVSVSAHITGLEPNSTHGIHIHQYGDITAPDGTNAGGHYNPEDYDHGLPDTEDRHAGDLGNLTADENGTAHYQITVSNVTIAGLSNPIIGRGVIVHAQADDGGQPTGNAGARIAQGVIGIAKPSP
ncbi:MAG: superoxide dismutase family protein [Phycisphaeraceae bacterium]